MGVGGASREAGWLLARMTVHDNVHAVHAILLITVPMVPGNTLGAREDVRGVILLCGPQPTCQAMDLNFRSVSCCLLIDSFHFMALLCPGAALTLSGVSAVSLSCSQLEREG